MAKWICEYAELDTDIRNPIEQEPFCFDANSYEEAKTKANNFISNFYNYVEFEVYEATDEDLDSFEYVKDSEMVA